MIANGQIGTDRDPAQKAVVMEVKDIPDLKQYLNRMVDLALAQMKNMSLAIPKAALVSCYRRSFKFHSIAVKIYEFWIPIYGSRFVRISILMSTNMCFDFDQSYRLANFN